MKKLKKIIVLTIVFLLTVFSVKLTNNTSVYAASGGVGYTIAATFPDANLAQSVATELNKNVNDVITQADIDNQYTWRFGNKDIRDISGVEYFVNLEQLYLNENPIEQLPNAIGNLVNLQELNLNKTLISSAPASFGDLDKLVYLYLSYTNVVDIPESIGNMTNLSSLSLGYNGITSIPNSITNLTKLETLALNNNKLTSIPDSISNMTKLWTLNVSHNDLESIPSSIGSITTLARLNLDANHLTSIPTAVVNKTFSSFSAVDQTITLPRVNWSDPISTNNDVVTGLDGSSIPPIQISNGGVVNGNVITWENLSRPQPLLSYSFSSTHSGGGIFSGTVNLPVTIPDNMEQLTITPLPDVTYTGLAHTPVLEIKDGATLLVEGVDYTLVYSNNLNAGTAVVSVTGKGMYSGIRDVNFVINKAQLTITTLPSTSVATSGEKISSVTLSNGVINGLSIDGVIPGTFSWVNPNQIITQSGTYEVIFIPNNTNYESISMLVNVTVESTKTDVNSITNTGDQTNIIMVGGLLVLSAAVFIAVKRRKEF